MIEATSTEEALREDFSYFVADLVLYRSTGPELPKTIDDVLTLLRERCFFVPAYVWFFQGEFLDVFAHLSEDGHMMQWRIRQ